jgi:hypothetical protein
VRAKENRLSGSGSILSSGNGVECFGETRQTLRRDLVVGLDRVFAGLGKVFDVSNVPAGSVVLYAGITS